MAMHLHTPPSSYFAKITLIYCLFCLFSTNGIFANEPDSAYLFAYSSNAQGNRSGLQWAWSSDLKLWQSIGTHFSVLYCDYGRWGTEKKMTRPYVLYAQGVWHAVWTLNNTAGEIAYTYSTDLIHWMPQRYPKLMENGNCLNLQLSYPARLNNFTLIWESVNPTSDTTLYSSTTDDFTTFSSPQKCTSRTAAVQEVSINGRNETGVIHRVPWTTVQRLLNKEQAVAANNRIWNEDSNPHSALPKENKPVAATFTVNTSQKKSISDLLFGVFFEDINYAADGGLYAERIQNRDFEYQPSDKEYKDSTWTATKCWYVDGNPASFSIDTLLPIHPNNKHYGVLKIQTIGTGLCNDGYEGIAIKKGEKFNASLFARRQEGKKGGIKIQLVGKDGTVCGESAISSIGNAWKKYTTSITVNRSVTDAHLKLVPQVIGTTNVDMISLFPENTFKGRANGLRKDIAQSIADIHPRFVRFPGGCVAHGDGLGNIYKWENTVGPLETRKPQRNLWGYHQSLGLGYYEYFQFCEDIGAMPLPVLAAGVPCQNSATGGAGQQCGIPLAEMDVYIQSILDLIEYANGAPTTKWGKVRADAGHPLPFHLKYIGIGNEDLISDVFKERFKMIYRAVHEKHPEITVVGTVGPSYEGSDYEEGWKFATELNVPVVDEHYYQSPGWFINNQHFYDRYDRSKSKVYLGEYASWGNSWYNALSEALYMTALERNGDVVVMSSYAPLLANRNHMQWRTDLIYFNNTEVKPTPNYEVQKLFSNHAGDIYFPSTAHFENINTQDYKRVSISVVEDSKTHTLIIKLVNALPYELPTQVSIPHFVFQKKAATRTVIAGNPEWNQVQTQSTPCDIMDALSHLKLPAFSITVFSVKL